MPALAPYIPTRDSQLILWLENFSTLISATPSAYGLSAGDAATIAGLVASYSAAYTPVTSPATKTAEAVQAKNTAKVLTLAQIRVFAQNIAINPGVSSSDKIAVGVNPRTSTPAPVTPPASNPVLVVQGGGNLSVVLRYRDSAASPSVKAKPYGAIQCQVRYGASPTLISDPMVLPNVAVVTKSPFQIVFTPSDGGKQAYFAARWATRRGEYSPWSGVQSFTVPVGG
jgi:hypothetical protein